MQIENLSRTLREIPDTDTIIFGGDTQISEYQIGLKQPDGWYDAWYEAGSDSHKYTYNSDINLLVVPPYKDRLDRVWYRSGTQELECVECKLYGHDSETAISSHYGVWVKFRFKTD